MTSDKPTDEQRQRDLTIRKLHAWRAEFLDMGETTAGLTSKQEEALGTLNAAIDSLELAERQAKAIRSEQAADPFVRLGAWLADRERGPRRAWSWAAHPNNDWFVVAVVLDVEAEPVVEHRGKGPTLESALTAALDKAIASGRDGKP